MLNYNQNLIVQLLREELDTHEFPHQRHSDEAILGMVIRTFTRVRTAPTYTKENRDVKAPVKDNR